MKLLHRKNLKEENYSFIQTNSEKVEGLFKTRTNTTVFQILIWSMIIALIVVVFNKFFIN
jgi:hypothetical protein